MREIFRKAFGIMAVSVVLFAVAGCSTPWNEIERNVDNSKNLRVGMTKSEVLEIMGEPVSDESYCTPDIWFYYVKTICHNGLVTEDECLPLVFRDGRLAGWGNRFYSEYRIKLKEQGRAVQL